MLIFVGYLYSWGAYKRMVKYETSSGDLVVPWEESGTRDWCWVPIFMGAYLYICKEFVVRMEMGAYIHGVPIITILR